MDRLQPLPIFLITQPLFVFCVGHISGPVVAHGIERPGVFDDEERYPFGVAAYDEKYAAQNERNRIDNEKGDVETLLVPRHLLVVGDVEKKSFEIAHIFNDTAKIT
jgi:hypothetical protein